MSAFEFYLRTGRRVTDHHVETKFNPWHDPENGRFTFARQGQYFGRGGAGSIEAPNRIKRGSAATIRRANTAATTAQAPAPQKPGPNQNLATFIRDPMQAAARIRREMGAAQPTLRSIPSFPETGKDSWRAVNDQIFIDAANKFNRQRGLKPGDSKYVDPLLLKAWAMVESGGSKSAFLSDPLQVNNTPDWTDLKGRVTKLTRGQAMTPEVSVEAALKWLEFRGYLRDEAGRPGSWRGLEVALRRYNGRSKKHPSGVPHSVWYANEVLRLHGEANRAR